MQRIAASVCVDVHHGWVLSLAVCLRLPADSEIFADACQKLSRCSTFKQAKGPALHYPRGEMYQEAQLNFCTVVHDMSSSPSRLFTLLLYPQDLHIPADPVPTDPAGSAQYHIRSNRHSGVALVARAGIEVVILSPTDHQISMPSS